MKKRRKERKRDYDPTNSNPNAAKRIGPQLMDNLDLERQSLDHPHVATYCNPTCLSG